MGNQTPSVMPATCADLVPDAELVAIHEKLELSEESSSAVAYIDELLGPKTFAALQDGDQSIYCLWGITGSDALASFGAAIIEGSAKRDLLAALRSSVFEELSNGQVEAQFIRPISEDHRYTEEVLIDGDVLIAVGHTIGGNFADLALSSIRAAQ